ncbi:MAG TPA: hypothetical protein VFF71_00705 [Luteimonas sp.]|nr:hypothetical protein [Luteimonas sp.]
MALGSGAIANGSETLALGKDASAGSNGVAVGAHTTAEGSNIAIGRNSSAWQSDVTGAGYLTGTAAPGNAVSVGSSAAGEAFQRRIINVADGAQRYDAVNVGQLEVAQQAVANLVGGNVTVEPNGTFGGYVIELQDTDGNSHQYGTVAEAINAVSSGDISVLPGNAVIYNPDGTITVAAGQAGDQAVNVDQLNAAIDENGIKYFSANTTEAANRNNDGATGANAMAIGPSAVASGNSSLAIGDAARVNAGADNGVAIGHDVSARAANTTVLGNRSHAYDQGGVAIGQEAVSQGRNSIVMGTGAEADPKSGGSVDNAIVIGTDAEATADDGIAVGQSALASEERAVAQGYDAHAMATDSQAFGTRARSTGVNAQASGTDANASGVSAIATGTRANASGTNAIANGTDSLGYASDGIAIGTGAVSGVASPLPEEAYRNVNGIAVGNSALADNHNALALGVEAQARAGSSTAIGDSAEATGERSSAMGYQASTQGTDSLAIGSFAVASGPRAGAIGVSATSSGNASYAMGYMANAESDNGIAIGTTSHVSGQSALAIGMNSNATGGSSLSAGVDSEASGASSAAIGRFANASGTSSLAVGYGSQASAVDSTAVGSGNIASGRQSVAIGSNNNAAANSSIAMGNGASTASGATNAIALGAGATAAQQGAVALGSGAVTATAVGTASITVDGNTYGFAGISPVATVSVGTPGAERTITNVAAGRINATSTDAINGSQLHGTNMALEALAGNLDTAGQSVASALGGGSSYNPATHQVTANLSVGGNTYNNVQDALTYVGQGWDVSAEGGASANVAPGGSVDFSSSDGNIEIARSGTDLAFELADDIEIGNSVTVGDTYIDGDSIVTNNLTVEGETRLGDNFVVNNNGDVTYNGAEIATQDDGLSFAGNTGGTISKTLGDNTPLTISGGLAASEASTGANLRVDSDGNQLNLVMARDLTDLDSITINNGGPVINGSGIDMGGNQITGLADGTADSDAVNLGQLKEVSEAANAGWNVSVDGEGAVAGNNVGPDGVVDFSNDDGNIEIDRTGTDLAFNLADDLEIGNSITVGDTVIDGTGVSVGDDVHLGDTGLVINGGPSVTAGGIDAGGTVITNVGPGVNGTDAVNMDQLTELAGTPLTFAGDAGTNVDRMLGETVNLVGGATDATALTDGNIGVVADGTDTLAIKLNKDIDLGADGSLAIGDTQVDTAGVAVTDAAGNTTTVGADGTTVDDGAGNTTTIGAGTVAVTDGTQTTTIGGTEVSVGGANPILISGDTGTIGGLTNTTFDPDNYTSGQAATEDQLKQVSDVANAGWNLTGSGADEVNIGPNGAVDFQGDTNITVAQTGVDQDGVIEVTLNRDLDVDSVTAGDTVLDTDGLAVTDAAGNTTTVGADGTTVDDGAGNTTTIGAGTVAVTDGVETTTIGATEVSVGGANPIVISGDTGTIGGLQNQTIDYPEFADGSGRAATEEQLDLVNQTANAGWNLTGSGADEVNIGPNGAVDFQGDTNITVAQTGVDQDGVIEVTLNRDLDVDSVTAGDTVLDTDGLAVTDAAGNTTTVGADGTTVDDGAGNTTTIGAGTVAVTDGAGTTTIGGTEVSVGGANPIVISGDTGTIGGLTNTTFDPNNYTSGQAATEDQLGQVYDVANAGWNVSAEGANATNVGVNSDTGNSVDLNNADGNIVISKTADSNDVTFDLAENIDLGADGSLTTGNTVVDTDGVVVTDAAGNTTTVAADGTTVEDVDGNSTAIGAGTVAVTDGTGTTTIGGNVVSVGGANPIVISGDTGTIGGLQNQTIDYPEFADGSGRAATEEQLDQVNQTANAGWNLTGSGADEVNIGPNGSVDFQGDGNITVAQTGVDQDGVIEVTLNRDLDLDSVTIGDTFIDTTGVAIGTDVHLGGTGLVINGGPSVTTAGIDAGGLVITNVAPGEISATSQDAVNGSQLHGMGDSITSIIGGNAVLNPDGTITTSDIGGTGYDNIDDAIRSANDAANAGWTATDAAGNDANIGPNGTVTFVGDDNVTVSQTGTDGDAVVEVTLNRDLDVDSITAGDTVIDTDGVSVGDDVHLGDTGLVIDGGPSVTTDGIDAGGDVISNVAAGVEDTDAVNVGQLNELAGTVNDNDERVTNLENGAAGPFQVSQDSNFVPPAPTGGNSAAGGDGAVASGDNSTALGNQSVASGHNSTAIGQGAQATHDNSVALGQGSATTVGAQAGYDAAYVGSSDSAGEVNVGNRTISGVAPGSAGTDAVNVNQLNAGVTQAVVTANDYTDQRFNQIQGDVWNLHGRVDELEKSINSGVASAMAMRQAPYVAGATTYYAGFGAYKGEGALGVSLRRTSDNGRWSLEGGFSANRDGTGGYIGVSGVLGGN